MCPPIARRLGEEHAPDLAAVCDADGDVVALTRDDVGRPSEGRVDMCKERAKALGLCRANGVRHRKSDGARCEEGQSAFHCGNVASNTTPTTPKSISATDRMMSFIALATRLVLANARAAALRRALA